jgi:hypothetical protein
MKIGVFAQYINTRKDLRDLILGLNKKMNIVLLLDERDKAMANLIGDSVEIRYFRTNKYKNRNYFFEKLFKLFGKLPKSKENYYITEKFKLHNAGLSGFFYFIEWSTLRMSKITLKFISYKKYLSSLKSNQIHILKDIDKFFCITQIYNDVMYAAIQKTKKPVINYVYSWDHACKMKCFLHDDQNLYLTWSEEIKEDLIELQYVSQDHIHVLGATQLIYLFDYLNNDHAVSKTLPPYIYMVGGTGTGQLLQEEVSMMEALIKSSLISHPEILFRIRPYPFVRNMEIYNCLALYPNAELEKISDFKKGTAQLPSDYESKYNSIAGALALFHFGTTLSLEAAHINVPVILIDTAHEENFKQLNGFIHQYQNDKYLNQPESINVLKSTNNINHLIDKLLASSSQFLPYNAQLKKVGQIENIETILNKLFVELNQVA